MSKSDDIKNEFLEFERFFNYFAETLADATKKVEVYSNTMDSLIRSSLDREVSIKNANKITEAEVKKSVKNIMETYERMGIQFGEKGKKIIQHLQDTAIAQAKSSKGLSNEKFKKDFLNVGMSEIFIRQQRALEKGDNNSFIKDFSSNKMAKTFSEEMNKKLGLQFNSFNYKIESFFGNHFREAGKNLKAFGRELLEGLEKSKFVGGALTDTFKLLGLMGASWLSHFGQLGRILGGAFYVVMSTAGPQLVNLLLKGMGSLVGNIGRFLGNKFLDLGKFLGKGAVDLAIKGGGAIGDLAKAGTNAQRALAVGKIAGGLGIATAGATGAFLAGREAGKDWKSGHKGRAVGFGIGAGLMGAGGIAAIVGLFSAAVAPFALPLVAIGAGVAVLVALWKHHSDFIKNAFKKVGSFLGKALEFMLMFNPIFTAIKWIRDNWPWGSGGGKGIISNAGEAVSNVSHKVKMMGSDGVTSYGRMKVAKDGSILNLHQLSQKEASEALQAYEKADPTSFNRLYEWADSKHANFKSFETDAVKFNEKGQKTGALLYRGASQDLDEIRSQLYDLFVSRGMSDAEARKKANALSFTSGKATGSNTQHTINVAKMMGSHADPYARGVDLGGGSLWSYSDYKDKGVQKIISGVVSKHGISKITAEGTEGKSTAPHLDLKQSGFYVPEGAKQNLADYEASQKVTAQKHSIDAMAILNKLDPKKAEDIEKIHGDKAGTYAEMTLLHDKTLGGKVEYNKEKGWIQTKDNKQYKIEVANPDGNKDFKEAMVTISKVANVGV